LSVHSVLGGKRRANLFQLPVDASLYASGKRALLAVISQP
jgi:hypothetical protein